MRCHRYRFVFGSVTKFSNRTPSNIRYSQPQCVLKGLYADGGASHSVSVLSLTLVQMQRASLLLQEWSVVNRKLA